MKTKILFITMIAAAMTAFAMPVFAQTATVNKKPAAPALLVEPANISVPALGGNYTFALAAHTVWSAAVNDAAASWCRVQPASGNGNSAGTITVLYNPAASARAATITFTSGALTRKVTIKQKAGGPPPYAASTRTWTFGNQTWSDAIQVPECNKASFTDSDSKPDCRSATNGEMTYYYYNWPYVSKYQDALCPAPWRVPAKEDFDTLVNNTNSTALSSAWRYGGETNHSSVVHPSSLAYYWSSTPGDLGPFYLGYNSSDYTNSNYKYAGNFGFQVRCVK